MLRKILGFAVLAVVAMVALNLAFGLLGSLFGLAMWLLKLALVGVVIYWVLKLISPSTAQRVKEMISGHRPPAGDA
jgi:uncharacterized membrane protein